MEFDKGRSDYDQMFAELRRLIRWLLDVRASNQLDIFEQAYVKDRLEYGYYQLAKFNCPLGWSKADDALVATIEMIDPSLTLNVPKSFIRHNVCPCVSSERLEHVKEAAVTLVEAMQESRNLTLANEDFQQMFEQPPQNVPLVEEDPLPPASVGEQLMEPEESMKEDEPIENPDDQVSSSIDLEPTEIKLDVNRYPTIEDGSSASVPALSVTAVQLSIKAELTVPDPSISCDGKKKKSRHRKVSGKIKYNDDILKSTLEATVRGHTISVSYHPIIDPYSHYLSKLSGKFKNRQDMFDFLCLYYEFRNLIHKKRNYINDPLLLLRGDNGLMKTLPSDLEFMLLMQ